MCLLLVALIDLPQAAAFAFPVPDKSAHIHSRVTEKQSDLMRKCVGFTQPPDQPGDTPGTVIARIAVFFQDTGRHRIAEVLFQHSGPIQVDQGFSVSVPQGKCAYSLWKQALIDRPQAVVALLDVRGSRTSGHRYFSGDTARKVHEARKLLGEDLAADLSVEALAEKVRLNRTTLQQVFRQMYGMTVYEYRTQVRMQEAKNLLLTGSLTVTEIAGRCGYTNASKFAAGFRRIAGMPPGEWRRRMKH